MAADDGKNLRPEISTAQIRSISEGNGAAAISDKGIGGGVGADDPGRLHAARSYANLKIPVVIIAGEQDKLIDIDTQSVQLHSDVSQSRFQQTATDQVMAAIREVSGATTELAAAE